MLVVFLVYSSISQSVGQPSIDWIAVAQKPFAGTVSAGRPLPPLTSLDKPIKTVAEWQRARESIKAQWESILGPPPAKPNDLQINRGAEESQPGFTRRLVSFHSEGGDRLEAYLLAPDHQNSLVRKPAVVVFHETTPLGFRQTASVAGDSDHAFGVELVRRGYIVLCPQCFILRSTGADGPITWAKLQAENLKRRRPGWTGMGKLTFDATRCIDFLESIEQVDASRIGCLGFSLGAKQVIYAMAFEERFKAGVAVEGGVGIEMSNWHDDWYLGPTIRQKLGRVDHHQLLALAAPRALLIQGGGSADGPKSWRFVEAALPIFDRLGARDRIGLFDHHGGHSFPKEARQVAYDWLDHWLQQMPTSKNPD